MVSTRYELSVDAWDHTGERLAQLKWPGAPVHGVVEWPTSRVILAGSSSVKGIGLDGGTRFDIPIDPPLRFMQAVSWKPSPESPTLLAFLAGGDRDLERWRLRIVEPDRPGGGTIGHGRVVFEEVFDQPPTLLVARTADSIETLFVRVNGLSVLRKIK